MTLDNNNLYNEKFYPDKQEDDLEVCSVCYSCGEVLYYGDEIIEWNGSLSCNIKGCLIKMVEAKQMILEKEED